MNNRKTNPVGIDKEIDRIQKRIYQPLVDLWRELDVYGRAYKKQTEDGISLEVYKGNGEYEKILYSEGNKIFFVQGDKPSIKNSYAKNDLWLVCILNLDEISNISHRADEEAHVDLVSLLQNDLTGIEYGMNNLKRVVEDAFSFGNFKYSDIHPYHVFTIRMEVDYSLEKEQC